MEYPLRFFFPTFFPWTSPLSSFILLEKSKIPPLSPPSFSLFLFLFLQQRSLKSPMINLILIDFEIILRCRNGGAAYLVKGKISEVAYGEGKRRRDDHCR